MTGQQGACPQCGAPIRFGGSHSLATVCSYCRSAVLRRGAEVELIGKVPDLVTTSTQLALGDAGKLGARGFRVVGRLQLDQGAAAWDEWYVQFDDGADGWLAEARGALFVTRRVDAQAPLPSRDLMVPDGRVQLPGLGPMTIDEVGSARFVSAEGELPFSPRVGASYTFADLSGKAGAFATLDFGEDGDEAELFAGKRLQYADAGLLATIDARRRSSSAAPAGAEGSALACPSCGAPLSLKSGETAAAACPSCRALLDVNRGALTVIGKLGKRTEPLIPLGAKGTLMGEPVEVLGYLRRYLVVDDQRYEWSEWQLWTGKGYAWLSEYGGHFHWVVPIPAGEVDGSYQNLSVRCRGTSFRHFQTSVARYADIQGELNWHARAQDEVKVADFTAPPYVLSCEREKREVNWSHGEYIAGRDVWRGLSLPGEPPRPGGVGMGQLNPHESGRRWAFYSSLLGFAGLIGLAVVVGAALPRERVADVTVPLTGDAVALSDPFELTAPSQSVRITAAAPISQGWAGLDVALINQETGEARTVAFELSHFEGVDDGERWTEGQRSNSATLGGVGRGTYLLRAEVSLDPKSAARLPPSARVEATRGVFLLAPLFLALMALFIPPLFVRARWASFERRRWSESDHSGPGDA